MRFCTLERVGFVFLRFFGIVAAAVTRVHNRSTQPSRLSTCDRLSSLAKCSVPEPSLPLTRCEPAIARRRARAASCKPRIAEIARCNSARVFTLFTFWPPGPLERLNVNTIADRGAQAPRPRSIASWGRTSGFGAGGGNAAGYGRAFGSGAGRGEFGPSLFRMASVSHRYRGVLGTLLRQ